MLNASNDFLVSPASRSAVPKFLKFGPVGSSLITSLNIFTASSILSLILKARARLVLALSYWVEVVVLFQMLLEPFAHTVNDNIVMIYYLELVHN